MLYISLRQYEYVCAIGRHGSLSAAAQALNVSQPALSNALTRVEEHLGHPLFARKRGAAMALTPQGRSFINEAEILLGKAARLENATDAGAAPAQLRLGCFTDLAPFVLAKALRHLRDALPDVAITYKVDDFENLVKGMTEGHIDLAITYGLTLDASFTKTELFLRRPHAFMPPDHAFADQTSVELQRLASLPLILSDEGLSAQHILGLFRQIDLHPLVVHRAASLEIQRSLAAHGEGVAISYADTPARISYDGLALSSVPITDQFAVEAVVLARHGTGPSHPQVSKAERALVSLMT